MPVWFCYDFFHYRHRVLVVINVRYLIFIVFSSSPLHKNFQWPSCVAFLKSIDVLLNDMYVLESFLSLNHLVAN